MIPIRTSQCNTSIKGSGDVGDMPAHHDGLGIYTTWWIDETKVGQQPNLEDVIQVAVCIGEGAGFPPIAVSRTKAVAR